MYFAKGYIQINSLWKNKISSLSNKRIERSALKVIALRCLITNRIIRRDLLLFKFYKIIYDKK